MKNASINDKGKDLVLRLLREAKADRRSIKAYENYTHSVVVNEIRCSDRMARIISMADYNNKGVALGSKAFRNPEWDSVDPGGIGDLLYQEVCR